MLVRAFVIVIVCIEKTHASLFLLFVLFVAVCGAACQDLQPPMFLYKHTCSYLIVLTEIYVYYSHCDTMQMLKIQLKSTSHVQMKATFYPYFMIFAENRNIWTGFTMWIVRNLIEISCKCREMYINHQRIIEQKRRQKWWKFNSVFFFYFLSIAYKNFT